MQDCITIPYNTYLEDPIWYVSSLKLPSGGTKESTRSDWKGNKSVNQINVQY